MKLTEQHVVGRAAQQRKELGNGSAATRLGEFGKLGKLGKFGEWLVGGAVRVALSARCCPLDAVLAVARSFDASGPVRSRTLDIDATRLA
ncbi:hypothetical protein [Streptomyces sp. NPDC006477]|uniref:hypothetical protein n=1 Tax=Streptomyces sp. NPDC006477 TaxID=3364747 RepID=UPI003674F33D